jgi:hypothetical protein
MMGKRSSKYALLVLAALTLGLVQTPAAVAAPPANDDFDSAVLISALPFTDSVDTTEATTAGDDPDCAGNGHTVWYSFTAPAEMGIEANTFGSDYDTTLSVYTGSRGALTQIRCNDDAADSVQSRVRFNATAGVTYFFMVGSFFDSPGGNLTFSVQEIPLLPPPLELGVTIDPVGSVVPRTGVATIHGTVTCSRPAFVDLFGELRQRIGRFLIRGFFEDFLECSGETPWSATVTGENGLFVPGRAQAFVFAFAFDPATGEEAFAEASATVRLRPSR